MSSQTIWYTRLRQARATDLLLLLTLICLLWVLELRHLIFPLPILPSPILPLYWEQKLLESFSGKWLVLWSTGLIPRDSNHIRNLSNWKQALRRCWRINNSSLTGTGGLSLYNRWSLRNWMLIELIEKKSNDVLMVLWKKFEVNSFLAHFYHHESLRLCFSSL